MMTLYELLEELKKLQGKGELDAEACHQEADYLLLDFIDNETVTKNFQKIERWYS